RTRQDALQRPLNAAFEAGRLPRGLIKTHQPLNIGIRHTAPIGASRERGDDLASAGLFFGSSRRTTHENLATAWRITRPRGVKRPGHHEHFKVRMAGRIARVRRTPNERLQTGWIRGGAAFDESGGDHVRTGLQSQLEMAALIDLVAELR